VREGGEGGGREGEGREERRGRKKDIGDAPSL